MTFGRIEEGENRVSGEFGQNEARITKGFFLFETFAGSIFLSLVGKRRISKENSHRTRKLERVEAQ